MEEHIKLFEHFGPERVFSTDEGMRALGYDPEDESERHAWARGPRTAARKRAYIDKEFKGHMLCCLGTKDEMIFTRDPDISLMQWLRGRRNKIGSNDTFIAYSQHCLDVGVESAEHDIEVWLWMAKASQKQYRRQLNIEAREAALRKREAV